MLSLIMCNMIYAKALSIAEVALFIATIAWFGGITLYVYV